MYGSVRSIKRNIIRNKVKRNKALGSAWSRLYGFGKNSTAFDKIKKKLKTKMQKLSRLINRKK